MTSISSRLVPASSVLGIIRAFVREHHLKPHPLHEVDAHVLSGQIYSVMAAARNQDFDISAAGQMAQARKQDGRTWVMVCHDNMSGRRPIGTAQINLQMDISDRGVHLVLTVSDISLVGPKRPLPYRLERVLVRSITTNFWDGLNQAGKSEETSSTYLQTLCA